MGISVGGVAFVKTNGSQIPLRGNLTINIVEEERTGVAGLDGVHGFTTRKVVPSIEGDVTTMPGFSIQDALNLEDGTVQAECDNGQVYVLRNAWQSGLVALNMVEGSGRFVWQGMKIDEFEGVAA